MNNKYLEAYSKRINYMNLCLSMCVVIILGCFFNLQVLPHPDLKKVVINHGYIQKTIIGNRGKIVDRNENELAVTINRYKFFVNTVDQFDQEKIITLFCNAFDKSEGLVTKKFLVFPCPSGVKSM